MYDNGTSKTAVKQHRDLFRGDKALWVIFFLLTAISLIAVYSSIGRSAIEDEGTTPMHAFIKHVCFVFVTYVTVIVVARFKYSYFSRLSQFLVWISAALLIMILVTHGQRWIVIPGVGQFQPSEIAKVALIVYTARMVVIHRDDLQSLETFLRVLVPIVLISLLVLFENFSTAALIFLSCYVTMYFGGVNKRYWWRLFWILLVAMVLALAYLAVSDESPDVGRSSTWGARVERWWNNDHEQLTQENMARMAVARGGVIGVGVGNTVFARLMTQANNDFIYAIIIEETGFVGGFVVLLIYSIFFLRCVKIASKCQRRFGMMIVIGMGTVIYVQALVNMSVAVGVLPVTGQTLPFISSGGTAYLFLGMGIGIIQSVAYANQQEAAQTEKATLRPNAESPAMVENTNKTS